MIKILKIFRLFFIILQINHFTNGNATVESGNSFYFKCKTCGEIESHESYGNDRLIQNETLTEEGWPRCKQIVNAEKKIEYLNTLYEKYHFFKQYFSKKNFKEFKDIINRFPNESVNILESILSEESNEAFVCTLASILIILNNENSLAKQTLKQRCSWTSSEILTFTKIRIWFGPEFVFYNKKFLDTKATLDDRFEEIYKKFSKYSSP